MLPHDIQVLIHQIELMTKKFISGPLLGDWHSAYKGAGFEFDQLREYIQGDDIRFIDWKASARSNKMLVRQYLEDRNKTVYIVVDISASTDYGTEVPKSNLMRQLAAVLAFIAHHKKDSVGLILFSEDNEIVIPPRQSRTHILSLLNTLFSYKAKKQTTNMAAPLDYIAHLKSKKALVCFISDFTESLDSPLLSIAARKHDILAFRCLDEREWSFPDAGTLIFEDAETGEKREFERTDSVQKSLTHWHTEQKDILMSAKIDCLDLIAGKPYTKELVTFLGQRLFD